MHKKEKTVTCSQVAKWIPGFMKNELKIEELELFLNHIQKCRACEEELSIQYLVTVGLDSLESSNNFDLQSELETALEMAHKKVRMHHFMIQAVFSLILLAAFGLFVTLVLFLLF